MNWANARTNSNLHTQIFTGRAEEDEDEEEDYFYFSFVRPCVLLPSRSWRIFFLAHLFGRDVSFSVITLCITLAFTFTVIRWENRNFFSLSPSLSFCGVSSCVCEFFSHFIVGLVTFVIDMVAKSVEHPETRMTAVLTQMTQHPVIGATQTIMFSSYFASSDCGDGDAMFICFSSAYFTSFFIFPLWLGEANDVFFKTEITENAPLLKRWIGGDTRAIHTKTAKAEIETEDERRERKTNSDSHKVDSSRFARTHYTRVITIRKRFDFVFCVLLLFSLFPALERTENNLRFQIGVPCHAVVAWQQIPGTESPNRTSWTTHI